MSQHKTKNDLIGHNSKSFNKPNYQSIGSTIKNIVDDIINGILEKDLYYDLALSNLEDARVATRIADRFGALHHSKENVEAREEPIKVLKRFQREVKGQGRGYVYKHEWNDLRSYFGQYLVDYFQDKVATHEVGGSKEFSNEN